MHFAYSILYVEDVAATLAFYEKAFHFKQKFLHEAGDYGELESGGTTLAFSARSLMADQGFEPQTASPTAPSFEIAFTTEDVAAAIEHAVASGAQLIKEPMVKPWGQTVGYVADPNGFLIEICTPITT